MAVLPPELWPHIILRAASSLSDLAHLSAVTRATRAMCWTSLGARQQFLTTILTDGRPAIEIFASDPKLLKNPRAFPDLPEFLALLFSDGVWPENYVVDDEVDSEGYLPYVFNPWDEEGSYEEEGLLERICGIEGDENDLWVRACLQVWPINIAEGTAPNIGGKYGTSRWHQRHHFTKAVVKLLFRGRLDLLPLMIGDLKGPAVLEVVGGDWSIIRIIEESKDPMLILTELFDWRGCHMDDHLCAKAIGAAAARNLVDVVERLGRLHPGLRHDPSLQQRVWGIFIDRKRFNMTFDMNFVTVKAIADLGIRINSNYLLMVLTHLFTTLPESLEDDAVLFFIADNIFKPGSEFDAFHPDLVLYKTVWRLIDRPRLRQQLIERRILPQEPACVTFCLQSVVRYDVHGVEEISEAEMVELARRAVKQGAKITQRTFLSALSSGSVDYARLAFESTKDHDLARWRETFNLWKHLAYSSNLTVDICHLVLDAGFKINYEALLILALEESYKDGDVAVRMLRVVLDAAESYRHDILRESCDMRLNWHAQSEDRWGERCRGEDEGLPEIVGMLLEFGFRPSRIGFFEENSLPKTKKVVEEFLKKNGLSVDDLSPLPYIPRQFLPFHNTSIFEDPASV